MSEPSPAFTVRLPKPSYNKVKAHARERRLSMSDLIRLWAETLPEVEPREEREPAGAE